MFTVIAAEQHHLDCIQAYQSFLAPLFDENQVAFCRWFPDADTPTDAIPELTECVSRHEHWRLLVVADDEGLTKRNPFDLVACELPEKPVAMDDSGEYIRNMQAYFAKLTETKEAAYREAAQKPLTRLSAWFCEEPLRSNAWNEPEKQELEKLQVERPIDYVEYLYLKQYRTEMQIRGQIRETIRNHSQLAIEKPSAFLCVALRCCDSTEDLLKNSWVSHTEQEYSRFCERNLYSDRLRFLCFDILPQGHKNYTFDYIRFLYSLLLLGKLEMPASCLAPNRVYTLECENDEQTLSDVLTEYDAKLATTQDVLRGKKNSVRNKMKPRLTDRDAEILFCGNVQVPVTAADFDVEQMYIRANEIGLSTDCPEPEEQKWNRSQRDSFQAYRRFMKQPRRAISRATVDFQRMNTADMDLVGRLNRFQREDVAEHTSDEEVKMVESKTMDLYQTKQFEEQIKEADRHTKNVIARRMTKKMTIGLGAAALGLAFLGLLPAYLSKTTTGKSMLLLSVLVFGALALLAAVGIICLFCLRLPLKRAHRDYNNVMLGVVNDVSDSMLSYSQYLSHACNVMRGHSVLNYLAETEDPETLQERILEKHITDVERTRQELHEVFGTFLRQTETVESGDFFDYNYEKAVDYSYPILFTKGMRTQIEFMQTGNRVEIPLNFVKRVSVRREELYE